MKIILPMLLLMLASCATPRSELARSAIPNLNRQTLLNCLGMPDAQQWVGEQEILTYNSTLTDAICPLKSLVGIDPPLHHCQAEFVLEGEKVRSISYRQQDGAGKPTGSQCAYILENCGK